MSSPNKAIGGYFELELPQGEGEKYPNALKYQSARAAFFALLQQMPDIKRVWMPYYICDSMLAPVYAAHKELVFYGINERFSISENQVELMKNDLLLYVNYFGVCDNNVLEVLRRYAPEQIVIDCSQAFYSAPFECLATIYSPRKFFGVPDGGLLVTTQPLTPPAEQDRESITRCDHLLKRMAFSAEDGYEDYKKDEASLNDLMPKEMSVLTQRMMAAIEYSAVQERRAANFEFLKDNLGSTNRLQFDSVANAPLCYPYIPEKGESKELLISKKIFIPTYWPDVSRRVNHLSFELNAANNIFPIPCDQRYNENDLSLITELFK